jgi:hypothetical protein
MDDSEPRAHIVYCHKRTLLDKWPYAGWREIQDAYEDYMASLGAWNEAEFIEFFAWDFGPDDAKWPFARREIEDFFRSGDRLLESREP